MTLAHVDRLWRGLLSLGSRRLALFGGGICLAVAILIAAMALLARAEYQTLYTGLTPSDANRIAAVLGEAGIRFEQSADTTKVLVPVNNVAAARVLLAEKGLPASTTAGYELFDKVGSLGLTSFMQSVTRTRALEGELARTIQSLRGVRAARVHLVLPDTDRLQRQTTPPSASVVVRLGEDASLETPRAIRHLVAAAVPSLASSAVEVHGTDGTRLLAANSAGEVPDKLLTLEKSLSDSLGQKVRETLGPYLGFGRFTSSITVRLNIDRQQTAETAFDPKSKVERSVKTVREADKSENGSSAQAATVTQNIPGLAPAESAAKDVSSKSKDRREETSNFEINTTSRTTEVQGYRVERLTVAVVVDSNSLTSKDGEESAGSSTGAVLAEIKKIVGAAIGADEKRGDVISVSAVVFKPSDEKGVMSDGSSIVAALAPHIGTTISVTAFVVAVLLLILLGLRPMTLALSSRVEPTLLVANGQSKAAQTAPALSGGLDTQMTPALPGADVNMAQSDPAKPASMQSKLTDLVSAHEDRAVAVLRTWLHERVS
jgi:flagellar M-ring protein FliF